MPPILLLAALACRGSGHTNDYIEPELTLDTPAPASWEPVGPAQATGVAANLNDVRVNRQPATVEGDSYVYDLELVRGVNTVEVRATDSRGDDLYLRNSVLAGAYIPPTDPVNSAAWIRVNRTGLDLVFDQVGALIDKQTVNESLALANPVLDTTFAAGGAQFGTMRVDLTHVDFSDLWATGAPANGRLDVVVHLDQLAIDTVASGDAVGVPYSEPASVYIEAADITASLTVGVLDHKLDVQVTDVTSDLTNVTFDLALLPNGFEQNLVIAELEPLLEAQLAAAIAEQVPPLLTEVTAGLDLSFHTELMGKPIDASARFAAASIDPDGLLLDVDVDAQVQGNAGYPYEGYLTANGMGSATPDRAQDMAVSVYDDLINRILFEAWRSGMMEQALSTADGSLDLAIIAMLGGTDQGSIDVRADLPPVIVDEHGQLLLQFGELIVDIHTPGGALGEQLSMAVAGSVPLTPMVENGVFKVTLGRPELVLSVRGTTSQASTEALTQLLEENLPVSMLLGTVGDIAIPLPTLAGVGVRTALAERDPTGAWTQLLIDLEAAP